MSFLQVAPARRVLKCCKYAVQQFKELDWCGSIFIPNSAIMFFESRDWFVYPEPAHECHATILPWPVTNVKMREMEWVSDCVWS